MNPALPVIEAHRLVCAHDGRTVLEVGHLTVPAGQVLCLTGPNGAGKSTLLHTLALLHRPVSGDLALFGTKLADMKDLTPCRRRLAVVFQKPLLLRGTVFHNVSAGLRFRGMPGPEIRSRTEEALELTGISRLAQRSSRQLSGGEMARVGLARALATAPEILLLDEPFSSLDPPTRLELLRELPRLIRRPGLTTIFTTHDFNEALQLAGRLAVLWDGRIRQTGTVEEVTQTPADAQVAELVGVETILPGRVRDCLDGVCRVEVHGRIIEAVGEAAPGQAVLLCLRPENVILHEAGPGQPPDRGSARNLFPGRVVEIVPCIGYFKVRLDCGFPLHASVTRSSLEQLALAPGAPVLARFKATAVHVIAQAVPPSGSDLAGFK